MKEYTIISWYICQYINISSRTNGIIVAKCLLRSILIEEFKQIEFYIIYKELLWFQQTKKQKASFSKTLLSISCNFQLKISERSENRLKYNSNIHCSWTDYSLCIYSPLVLSRRIYSALHIHHTPYIQQWYPFTTITSIKWSIQQNIIINSISTYTSYHHHIRWLTWWWKYQY